MASWDQEWYQLKINGLSYFALKIFFNRKQNSSKYKINKLNKIIFKNNNNSTIKIC